MPSMIHSLGRTPSIPWNDPLIPTRDQKETGKSDTLSLSKLDIGNEVERRMPVKWRDQQSPVAKSQGAKFETLIPQLVATTIQASQPQNSSKSRTTVRRKWQRHVVGGRADNRPGSCAAFMQQHQPASGSYLGHRTGSSRQHRPERKTTVLPSIRPTAVDSPHFNTNKSLLGNVH